MKLLIATHNQGKLEEYKSLLKDLDLKLEVLSLKDLNVHQEAPEEGENFKEISIKKAKFYYQLTKIPTLSDDGGLMIDFLGGEPGIKSRTWFGYRMTDEEMIKAVLEKMKGVPLEKRTARLVAVVSLVISEKEIYSVETKIEGIISEKPSEKILPGYPFRSIFYFPEIGKFYSELTKEEHEKFNHRRKALLELYEKLKKLI